MLTQTRHPFALIRDPYEMVHMSSYWAFTVPDNQRGRIEVVANFDKVNELTTGGAILSGSAQDEYGWWHRSISISLNRVHDLRRCMDPYKDPEPAPFPVSVNFEWRPGTIRLTIPDEAARRLKAWNFKHWHEFVGMGDGYSDSPRRGTWEHKALAYLHAVQSHLTDDMPFIQGESFDSLRTEHGHPTPEAWELFVHTSGVRSGVAPTVGFHFSG